MGRLDGKVAVITGGTGGIGLATATRFLAEGASVVLVDKNPEVVAMADALGAGCLGIEADVTDGREVDAFIAAAVAKFGGLDVVFANAGIEGKVAPLHLQHERDLDRVFSVNIKGPWQVMRAAVPHLIARGGGSILVTSSIAGLVGSVGLGPYVASKHAVMGLVKTAALELATHQIRVNSVNPGPVDNRMMTSIADQAAPGNADFVRAAFEKQTPLGRYMTNEEIASVALFLASDDSSGMTGTSLVADGGFLAQ